MTDVKLFQLHSNLTVQQKMKPDSLKNVIDKMLLQIRYIQYILRGFDIE